MAGPCPISRVRALTMPGAGVKVNANFFTKKQLDRYADVLIWGLKKARTKPYRRKDIIMVRFNVAALGLAERLQARLLAWGMHPIMRMVATPVMELAFFGSADDTQLVFEAPGERELYRNLNGSIYLNAPESLTHLQKVDAARIARAALARKPIRDILSRREEQGQFGWTLCSCTTPRLSRHAGLSPQQYTRHIVKACYLDRPDPAAEWEDVFRNARCIKKWLTSMPVKHYHVESAGIDLRIARGERRRWMGISGHNIPSFELFISPDWRDTSGVYYADQPCFRDGNRVQGVRLEFQKGALSRIDAGRNRDFVVKQLSMDKGAGRLGEFSLTDIRFSKIDRFMADTLFDENFGGRFGNCHIALGASYSDTFSGNPATLTKARKAQLGFNDSALHWDLVNTEDKMVTACLKSGKRRVIYEKGMFAC
jgi:aminopeptidase